MECHRETRQKQAILDILRSVTNHPTADELYELVRKRIPAISLGTVYRNLDRLAASGQIRRIQSAGSQMRFDGCIEPHTHIRCMGCGRVDDIEAHEELRYRVDMTGYEVQGHRLEFYGFCPACLSEDRRASGGRQGVGRLAKKSFGE